VCACLNQNNLTSLPLYLTELPNLKRILLHDNPLTLASKIALRHFGAMKMITVGYNGSDEIIDDTVLTLDILNDHFKHKDIVIPDNAFKYLRAIGTRYLLLSFKIPAELIMLIAELNLPPELERLYAEMNLFIKIFNLPTYGKVAIRESENVLHAYNNTGFKDLVINIQGFYRDTLLGVRTRRSLLAPIFNYWCRSYCALRHMTG